MRYCSSVASISGKIYLACDSFDTRDEGFFICDSEAAYRPRNPEDNPLYGIVAEHLETFLAREIWYLAPIVQIASAVFSRNNSYQVHIFSDEIFDNRSMNVTTGVVV